MKDLDIAILNLIQIKHLGNYPLIESMHLLNLSQLTIVISKDVLYKKIIRRA